MPLVTVQNLRDWFAVPSEIKDARLDFVIGAASRTLRSWVTDAVYNDTTNVDRAADLQTAEANLAMYHLLLNTGARIRASGVAKKEQDKTGDMQSGLQHEFLTPEELQELRAEYFAAAEAAALKYRPAVSTTTKKAMSLISRAVWKSARRRLIRQITPPVSISANCCSKSRCTRSILRRNINSATRFQTRSTSKPNTGKI